MRTLVAMLTSLLCLSGQQSSTDASQRCADVNRTVTSLQILMVAPDADLAAAGAACQKCLTALRTSSFEQASAALAEASALLDRLGLTDAALFGRFEQAAAGAAGLSRFYVLPDLAKTAFNLGDTAKAGAFAHELLSAAPRYLRDWNYGNALYYGNFVLGRIALKNGDLSGAGKYLLDAGRTPGSPQLNTFGPNVTLAKELLEKGVTAPVLEYFALCKNFWKMDRGQLDAWSAAVRSGVMPEFFGGNLNY